MGAQVFAIGDARGFSLVFDVVERREGGRGLRCASCLDGVLLDDGQVGEMIAALTAYRDEPRIAARATAEVVASDPTNDLELVKTTAGEWGVLAIEAAFDDGGKATGNERRAIEWFSGDGCESSARVLYAEERGKSLCESCLKETDLDDLIEAGEDGPMVCESCADELHEEFTKRPYRCDPDRGIPSCGWTGTGADVVIETGQAWCPKCGGEAVDVGVEPAGAGE